MPASEKRGEWKKEANISRARGRGDLRGLGVNVPLGVPVPLATGVAVPEEEGVEVEETEK